MRISRTGIAMLVLNATVMPLLAQGQESVLHERLRDAAQAREAFRRDIASSSVAFSSSEDALHSLRDAVSADDRPRFESTLAAARSLADRMPISNARNSLRRALLVCGDLETVWKFASSNRAGSFYDDDVLPGFHDHLSADYPSYQRFIAEFRIFDRTGRTFYPTAETRSFLFRQLAEDPPPTKLRIAPITKKKTSAKPRRSGKWH